MMRLEPERKSTLLQLVRCAPQNRAARYFRSLAVSRSCVAVHDAVRRVVVAQAVR